MKHKIAEDLIPLAKKVDEIKLLDGNPRIGDVSAVKKSYELQLRLKIKENMSKGANIEENWSKSMKFDECITLWDHFLQYLTNVSVFGHPPGAQKSNVRMTETCCERVTNNVQRITYHE